jgi:hypothetical protein
MIELQDLQKIVEQEGELNHKLTSEGFFIWLYYRHKRNNKVKLNLYEVILDNPDLLKRVHLELEYGCFTHNSEVGSELYVLPGIIGKSGMKSCNFNFTCGRLQENYSEISDKERDEIQNFVARYEKVAQMG